MTYLCGGINGLTDTDCNDWRTMAKKLLRHPTLDPMRRDYRGSEADNVNSIVAGDLEDIQASTFVLVNATRPSWGTAMEVVYAYQAGKRIHAFVESGRISPWLRFHCSAVHTILEEACAAINQERTEHDRIQAVSI